MNSYLLRFCDKVRPLDNGCWEWQSTINHKGYGLFQYKGRNISTHRFSYLIIAACIPRELQIDHLCRNRRCVNPSHMELVTSRENSLRGIGFASVNAKVTHCPKRHPYSEENTYITPQGSRGCRICLRNAKRRYKEKQREKRGVLHGF